MLLQIDQTFPQDYEIVTGPAVTVAGKVREFARSGRVSSGGVLIEVSATSTWVGLVANGVGGGADAYTGIHSTPAPSVVCVVAAGDAIFIDVERPGSWHALPDGPVVAVGASFDDRLLLFATRQRIIAVRHGGEIAWRTSRIAVDGIRLDGTANGELRGVADPLDESAEFVVDLSTGRHRGGRPFRDAD